jgi:hypothetical protein
MDDKKYAEIGNTYRFFLAWRQVLIAGMLAVLYGVLSVSVSAFKDSPSIAWAIPLLAWPIGRFFLLLDQRNRDLYWNAIKAGELIEKQDPQAIGLFSAIAHNEYPAPPPIADKPSHTTAIEVFFLWSSRFMIGFAIVLAVAGIVKQSGIFEPSHSAAAVTVMPMARD